MENKEQFIVIYRAHNQLMCETKHYGPYSDYMLAEDKLCALGALGHYEDDGLHNNPGCKYIEVLCQWWCGIVYDGRYGAWMWNTVKNSVSGETH